ncbi:hypothetical protein H4S07_004021, partial [Coemansia furcata]
ANLYNSENILPNMALQLLALADTLGHGRVFISIYENGSKDKTKEILGQFNSTLNTLGIAHRIRTDEARRPEHTHRIEYLAKVRNLALEPLYSTGKIYDRVLFINDIYFCMNDLLELAYQSRTQSTHLTCAEDFVMFNEIPGFYDTWVARDMPYNHINSYQLTLRMFARTISVLTLAAIYSVAALPHQPTGTYVALSKRCGGCGGYRGFGFPFVSSVTNDVDANANFANFNENTLYANNVNANAANKNVHAFNNANVIV